MPILQNPRHEAFAQSRARGALLEEAYEYAGFIPGHGHASRLGATPEVVERIAELNMARFQTEEVTSSVMIAALLRVAQSSEALGIVGGIEQARLAILEAQGIAVALAKRHEKDRNAFMEDLEEAEADNYELMQRRAKDPDFRVIREDQ